MANRKQEVAAAIEQNVQEVNERQKAAAAPGLDATASTAQPKPKKVVKAVLHPGDRAAMIAPPHPRSEEDRLKRQTELLNQTQQAEVIRKKLAGVKLPDGKGRPTSADREAASKAAEDRRVEALRKYMETPVSEGEKKAAAKPLKAKKSLKKPNATAPASKMTVHGDFSAWKPGKKDPKIDRKGRK